MPHLPSRANSIWCSPELQPYLFQLLPVELKARLSALDAPLPQDIHKIHQHLDTLWHSLRAMVPNWVHAVPEYTRSAPLVSADATLLFADVTGFTAFSAGLEALGRSGKEYTVALLNRLFASLVQVAMHHGGDILAFGGDALLVTFNGAESAKAAATAAWEMQEVVVSSGFRGGVYWRSEP